MCGVLHVHVVKMSSILLRIKLYSYRKLFLVRQLHECTYVHITQCHVHSCVFIFLLHDSYWLIISLPHQLVDLNNRLL